jgi:hypothetical protein
LVNFVIKANSLELIGANKTSRGAGCTNRSRPIIEVVYGALGATFLVEEARVGNPGLIGKNRGICDHYGYK